MARSNNSYHEAIREIAGIFGVKAEGLKKASLSMPVDDCITVEISIAPDSDQIAEILRIRKKYGLEVKG